MTRTSKGIGVAVVTGLLGLAGIALRAYLREPQTAAPHIENKGDNAIIAGRDINGLTVNQTINNQGPQNRAVDADDTSPLRFTSPYAVTGAGTYEPPGGMLAGITWDSHFTDVRLPLANVGSEPIEHLTLTVSASDNMLIGGVGQLTEIPGLVTQPIPGKITPLSITVMDDQGHTSTSPINMGKASAPSYSVSLPWLPANSAVQLVVATVDIRPPNPDGTWEMYGPVRPPKALIVDGQYTGTGPGKDSTTYLLKHKQLALSSDHVVDVPMGGVPQNSAPPP